MTHKIPESIESARLMLAMPQAEDWPALHAYYSDAECARYTFQQPLPESETQRVVGSLVRHWERKGYGPYVVREKQSAAVVGLVGLWFPSEWPETEIKWAIVREHWGKGYASEAVREIEADMAALQASLPMKALHVLFSGDREMIDEALGQYSYTVPLNQDALLFGAAVSLLILLILELLFALSRFVGAKAWRRLHRPPLSKAL